MSDETNVLVRMIESAVELKIREHLPLTIGDAEWTEYLAYVAHLRAALTARHRYLSHDAGCPMLYTRAFPVEGSNCMCGLAALLKETK